MTGQVLVLHPDGGVQELPLDVVNTLPWLYRTIGCTTVDAVPLQPDLTMWCDDEGALTGQPLNENASWVAYFHGVATRTRVGAGRATMIPYVGTVVFAGSTRQGDTIALTQGQLERLHRLLLAGGA